MDPSILRSNHPLRPSDWRWERAKLLLSTRQRPRRSRDDHYIAQAIEYLCDCREAGNDPRRLESLYDRWGALRIASQIYMYSDKRTRHMLEAWLLAHIPLDAIASRTGLPHDVVRYYGALYFDVNSHLRDTIWIMGRVLPQAGYEGFSHRNSAALLKLVGYAGGEHVLAAFIGMSTDVSRPAAPEEVGEYCRKQIDGFLSRGRLVNAMGMNCPDATTQLQFEAICQQLDQIRADTGHGGLPFDYVAHIEAMMRSLPFGIGLEGRCPEGVRSVGPAGPEDTGATELWANDMILLRMGFPVRRLEGMPEPEYPSRE